MWEVSLFLNDLLEFPIFWLVFSFFPDIFVSVNSSLVYRALLNTKNPHEGIFSKSIGYIAAGTVFIVVVACLIVLVAEVDVDCSTGTR